MWDFFFICDFLALLSVSLVSNMSSAISATPSLGSFTHETPSLCKKRDKKMTRKSTKSDEEKKSKRPNIRNAEEKKQNKKV